MVKASRPFWTPSKATSRGFGDVEAIRFRRLLLPKLLDAELTLVDSEEDVDDDTRRDVLS